MEGEDWKMCVCVGGGQITLKGDSLFWSNLIAPGEHFTSGGTLIFCSKKIWQEFYFGDLGQMQN